MCGERKEDYYSVSCLIKGELQEGERRVWSNRKKVKGGSPSFAQTHYSWSCVDLEAGTALECGWDIRIVRSKGKKSRYYGPISPFLRP